MGRLLKEMLEKECRGRLANKIAGATSLSKKEAIELVDKILREKLEFAEGVFEKCGIDQLQRYIKYVMVGEKDV